MLRAVAWRLRTTSTRSLRASSSPRCSISTASRARRSRRTTGSTRATSRSGTRSSASSPSVDLGAREPGVLGVPRAQGRSTFAIGGIKNHELYFDHLGGIGGDPKGAFGGARHPRLRLGRAWKADLKATGLAGRGWAWTAYDWDERRLFNYIGDAQNTFPVWNATPLVALDVYEHAYFIDFGTDRAGYIEAFFDNLDYGVVDGLVEAYGIRA